MGKEGDLLLLRTDVEHALNKSRIYLTSKIQEHEGDLVFTDQPDEGPAFLGTYGASCAAISLIATGASQNDTLVRQLLRYLCQHQMDSGGWTIRSASEVGLTTACAFSVIALSDGGATTEAEVTARTRGIEWLVGSVREKGWPYFSGGNEIGTTPTAFAVRALNKSKPFLSSSQRKVLEHGISCVEKAFENGSVQVRDAVPSRGSVAVTSLALITLVQAGFHPFLPQIQESCKWLTEQRSWPDDNSDSFYAYSGSRREKSAHVNYVHFTPALLLQAFLACEVDIVSESNVRLLARELISTQRTNGDWRSPLAVRETPTWMEMDAALGLGRLLEEIDDIKSTLRVRDEVSSLATTLQTTVENLNSVAVKLEARVGEFQTEITQQKEMLSVLVPAAKIFRSATKILKLAFPTIAAFLACAAYSYIRHRLQPSWSLQESWSDMLGCATFVGGIMIAHYFALRAERLNIAAGRRQVQEGSTSASDAQGS